MQIVRAKKMGFCFGVKEALKIAEEVIAEHNEKKVYMLGMLVHNAKVMENLDKKGVKIIEEEDIEKLSENDVVILRAHGVSEKTYEKLFEKKLKIYDAACIFVKKSRELLVTKEKEGYNILFVGDRNHPEVKGIVSYGRNVKIVSNMEEIKEFIEKLSGKEKYFVLAQTTLNKKEFNIIKDILKEKFPTIEIGDTICGATYERQLAIEELAKNVELVLIVGGVNSSNTRKLYNISKTINPSSYYIEKKEDIKNEWFEGKEIIGITAGASTPEESIVEVEEYLKHLK